ncbi:hypothetical protein ABMA27_011519 [Loxostege sticticalis]|uniref:Inosine/uridine-preferring nucleoside hydrolase domain-containing protein n=1 Tax=Loxostege sticticalis TaxID=481309 RepID=A0ABR3IGL3_LOXSC
MAIFLALLEEKYFDGPQVVGLTTVNGNVNETQAFINTQKILGVAERWDVPIYRGSREALVLDYPSDYYFGLDGLGDLEGHNVDYKPIKAERLVAALALIELSKKYKGELIIVAIAPLTNIALAIKLDPGFISRLKQLYVGAGNVYEENSQEAEFNALLDVEAYHIVAQYSVSDKVTVVPFNKMKQSLNITKEWRIQELGAINTKIMKAQNEFERVSLPQSKLWQLLDPMVMGVARSSMVEITRLTNNSIILCGPRRGINTNDFMTDSGNMELIYSASEDKYKEYLLKIFSADTN